MVSFIGNNHLKRQVKGQREDHQSHRFQRHWWPIDRHQSHGSETHQDQAPRPFPKAAAPAKNPAGTARSCNGCKAPSLGDRRCAADGGKNKHSAAQPAWRSRQNAPGQLRFSRRQTCNQPRAMHLRRYTARSGTMQRLGQRLSASSGTDAPIAGCTRVIKPLST